VHIPEGLTTAQLAWVMDLKNNRRGRIAEFAKHHHLKFFAGKTPWHLPCDIALPCATQNEINGEDAKALVKHGCQCVAEGANMPSDLKAVEVFLAGRILYGPGKAANAGGSRDQRA
jgi:glutamate dehydrogenase (NADP+)